MRNAMLTLKTTLKTATSGICRIHPQALALSAVLMWTASAARCRADSGALRCRSRYRRSW